MIRSRVYLFLFLTAGIISLWGQSQFSQNEYRLLERANDIYQKGQYARAIILYKKARQRGADPAIVSFNIGNCYYRLNKLPEAAASFRSAVRLYGNQPSSAQFNLAGALFRLEQYGESIAAYRRALKKSPDNISAWLYLAEAYTRTGDRVGAQMALERAHIMEPEDVSVLYQLAEIHVAMKEYDAAISLIKDAYSKKPDEVDFLFYIGDLYRSQGDLDQAAASFRQGLALKPEDYNVMYKLADVLHAGEKPFLAMDYLQNALNLKTDFDDAAVFLGNIAFDQKWWDRAESAYLIAVKNSNKEGLEGIRNLAYEFGSLKQPGKSMELLEIGLKYFPNDRELKDEIKVYKALVD